MDHLSAKQREEMLAQIKLIAGTSRTITTKSALRS